MVATERVELSPKAYETFALPLSYVAKNLVDRVGLEPTLPRLKGEYLYPSWLPVERQTRVGAVLAFVLERPLRPLADRSGRYAGGRINVPRSLREHAA